MIKRKCVLAKALAVVMMLNLITPSTIPVYAQESTSETLEVSNIAEGEGEGAEAVASEQAEETKTENDLATTEIAETKSESESIAKETSAANTLEETVGADVKTSVSEVKEQTADENTVKDKDSENAVKNREIHILSDDGSAEESSASKEEAEEETIVTISVEEEDIANPAYSYEYADTDSHVAIKIDAPEGAFPEGIQVNVEKVASEKIVEAIKNASDVDDIKASDVVAYDFDFYKDGEHHIEPKKEISVEFKNVGIKETGTVSAFHLENEDSQAEAVSVNNVNNETGSVELKAADFSIYAIVSSPVVSTDGKIWIDNDTTTTYNTINDAVNAAANGATIHIQGKFGENGAAATGATITKNITLDIAGDTEMTGNNSIDGITLTSGTKIRCSNGSKLTMTQFRTAFTVASGAEVNDGTYIFTNNKSTTRGIHIEGSVKGSTGRESVVIKADDSVNTNFYSGNATFENATIDVTSQKWTWKDASALNLKNVSMTLSGFGQGYYVQGGTIENSFLNMKDPGLRWGFLRMGSTGIAFQGGGTVIKGSTIQLDYGSNAGLSIGLANASTAMTIEDSVLDFRNAGTGGLNVNTGDITIKNTLIKGDGRNTGALYGAQTNGKITFINNSRVETPATTDADNGLGQGPSNYVVIGGSYLVKYTDAYYTGAAIPTNGTANGNEKLDYVTLADPTLNQVSVLNNLGNTYTYPVGTASSDGKKHIFVPTAKVTFDPNSATAEFADGTNTSKVVKTVRGNTVGLVEDNDIPAALTNTNTGLTFGGWYYTDSSGNEQPFTDAVVVTADMTVRARWNVQQTVMYNGTLEADILIDGDTEHTAVKDVNAGDMLNFTGTLDVSSIKNQIQLLSTQYGGNPNTIVTQNIQSTFIAELTFPGGFTLPDTPTATLTNNNLFEITSVTKNVNKITVTMKLKQNYANFGDLLTDVTGVPSILDVTVPNIKVSDNVLDMSQLTTVGTVEGTFSGKAIAPSGNSNLYDMRWTAVQTANGKDAIQDPTDNTTIQYTVKAANRAVLAFNETLYADILIGSDTEHTAVHPVGLEDELTYTGRVFVTPIKDKINALRARYTGDPSLITTSNITSTFTTTILVPSGLSIPSTVTPVLTENELFNINNVVQIGNTIQITMSLKKNYVNFNDLYNDVNSVPDVLNLDIPGIKVDSSNPIGTQLTLTGTVEGSFEGQATAPSGRTEIYNFRWTGVQLPDGKDFIQPASDNTSIQYTVEVVPVVQFISITVNKTWVGTPGDEAVIELYKGSEWIGAATLRAGNWRHTFDMLPKQDASGNLIDYSVRERALNDYQSELRKHADDNYEFINTFRGGNNSNNNRGNSGSNSGGNSGGGSSVTPNRPSTGTTISPVNNNDNRPTTPTVNDNNGVTIPDNSNNEEITPDNNGNYGNTTPHIERVGKRLAGDEDSISDGNSNGTQQGQGGKTQSSIKPNKVTKTSTTAGQNTPQTGDASHMGYWLAAMLISLLLIAVNMVYLSRRRKED